MSSSDQWSGGGQDNFGGGSGGNFAGPSGGSGDSPKNTLWLILNIVALFACWPGGLFALIGAIFAGIGLSKEKTDVADAASKAKIAKILFIVAVIFGILGYIALVLTGSLLNEVAEESLSELTTTTTF